MSIFLVTRPVDLRSLVPGYINTVHARHGASLGDGLSSTWNWDATSVDADDGVLTLAPAGVLQGRWRRSWDGVTLDARWAGVRGDCLTRTDFVCTAGDNTVTAPGAAFTAADVGKRILLRTPSKLGTGTISLTAAQHAVTCSGTLLLSEVANIPFNEAGGGQGRVLWPANALNQEPFNWRQVTGDTAGMINPSPAFGLPNTPFYRELQHESTITAVNSPTSIEISVAPTVSTGVWGGRHGSYGTDNRAALELAFATAIAAGAVEVLLPPGVIGRYGDNHVLTGVTGLRIRGRGKYVTVLKDLRRASFEKPVAEVVNSVGCITFANSARCEFADFGFDGSVPVRGFAHSTGGVENAAGGRAGLVFDNCVDCGWVRIAAIGFASRDEFCYAQNGGSGLYWDDLDGEANVNFINPNAGGAAMPGLRVSRARCTSDFQPLLMGGASSTISDCQFRGKGAPADRRITGASLVVLQLDGVHLLNNFVAEDSDSSGYGAIPILVGGGSSTREDAAVKICNGTVRNIQFGTSVKDCGLVGFSAVSDGTELYARGSYGIENVTMTKVGGPAGGHGGAHVFFDVPRAKALHVSNCSMLGTIADNMTCGVRLSERTPVDILEMVGNVFARGIVPLQVRVKGERITATGTRRTTTGVSTIFGHATTNTLHIFFRMVATTAVNMLFDRGWNGTTGGAHVRIGASRGWVVSCADGTTSGTLAAGTVDVDHIMTITQTGTALAVYLDGVLLNSTTLTTYAPVAVASAFGCNGTVSPGGFNPELPLYAVSGGQYSLTATQVAAHYAACKAKQGLLKHASDQHFWRFSTRGGAAANVVDEISAAADDVVSTSAGTAVSLPLESALATIVTLP